jgi:hypothetical protein
LLRAQVEYKASNSDHICFWVLNVMNYSLGNSKKQKKKLSLPVMLSFELSTWFLTSNDWRESQSSIDSILFLSLSRALYVLVLAVDFFVSHTKIL